MNLNNPNMQLIIHAPPYQTIGKRLSRSLANLDGILRLDLVDNLQSLRSLLANPRGMDTVCILVPSDGGELAALKEMRHLFHDIRTVLVLPDDLPETISNGHALRPRYISCADGNPFDIEAVVKKMVGANEEQRVWIVF